MKNPSYCWGEDSVADKYKSPFCDMASRLNSLYKKLIESKVRYERLYAYQSLRRDGYIPISLDYIEGTKNLNDLMSRKLSNKLNGVYLTKLADVLCEEGEFELARAVVDEFVEQEKISIKDGHNIKLIIDNELKNAKEMNVLTFLGP